MSSKREGSPIQKYGAKKQKLLMLLLHFPSDVQNGLEREGSKDEKAVGRGHC